MIGVRDAKIYKWTSQDDVLRRLPIPGGVFVIFALWEPNEAISESQRDRRN